MSSLFALPTERHLQKLSIEIPNILFKNDFIVSDSELMTCFQFTMQQLQLGQLNVEYVSLYQQRLLASLITLDLEKKQIIGNILALNDIWQSCITIFKARIDQLTVHILLKSFDNIVKSKSTESMYRIITDIDALSNQIIFSGSPRSLQIKLIKNNGKADLDDKAGWYKKAVLSQVKSQLNIINIFNEYVNGIRVYSPFDVARESNAFLMTYLKSGHVRNIWLYTSQNIKNQLPKHHQDECIVLNDTQDNFLLVSQIGDHIWIQADKYESFSCYQIPKETTNLQDLVHNMVRLERKHGYLFSRSGLWQYKLSITLKSQTNFSPKRSDYLKSSLDEQV
ncbi:hypothetical protein [Shewanella glacialipiscicola]|uniref:hypothetical protein n=1 Tax=Shewanella glacialipiscicola TaxID=614069 RepID=UPI003D79C722